MARNASGTFTLPAGNPVVSQTDISSTWANGTMTDLESAITDSLDRNGRGSMLAQLKAYAGTKSAPGLSFSDETGSGWYYAAAGDIRFSLLGSDVLQVKSGLLYLWSGTAWQVAFSSGDVISADTISEYTVGSGVTVDGVLLKDGAVTTDNLITDAIDESTADAGVTIDGVLLKDGGITATGTITFTGATIADLGTVTTADIDGGTIDGTTIGGSTPDVGTFTEVVTDLISEVTADAGVTIDGVILKDGSVTGGLVGDTVAESTTDAGVTIDGLLLKDGSLPEAAVTEHEGALSISESQIADLRSGFEVVKVDASANVNWSNVTVGDWTVAHTSTGIYTVTFPTAATSALSQSICAMVQVTGVSSNVNIRAYVRSITATGCVVETYSADTLADLQWTIQRWFE